MCFKYDFIVFILAKPERDFKTLNRLVVCAESCIKNFKWFTFVYKRIAISYASGI